MKTLKQSIIAVVVGLAMVAGISWAANWTGPSANPPGANREAPIHVGAEPQDFSLGKSLKVKGGSGVFDLLAGLKVTGVFQLVNGSQGSGKVLTSDASGVASWQTAPGEGGRQGFKASGEFRVPDGVTKVFVTMSGGGGGGGGGGYGHAGGGGGGATIIGEPANVTPGQRIIVLVGAGGSGGSPTSSGNVTSANSGQDGASSAFLTLTAGGGKGGTSGGVQSDFNSQSTAAARGLGGAGGTALGATYLGISGGNGGDRGGGNPGDGGGSVFGSGGNAGDRDRYQGQRSPGNEGSGFGGGGGGGGGNDTDSSLRGYGGAGSPGFVLVEW